MPSDQNRAFKLALLASLALHALLLFGFSTLRHPALRAAPVASIVAHLVEPAPVPAPPAAAPAPPQIEPLKPAPPRAAAPKPKPRAAPKPVPKTDPPAPLPIPEPSAPVEPAAPPAVARTEPVPSPAAPSAPATAAGAAATAPAPAAADSIDVDSLAQYRLQVASAARKYKRYPRVAIDNNWEGAVLIRVVIAANGRIAAVSVKTSSGYEVLDEQALDMFRKAAPLVQVPAALRGKEFAIEVRAIYNLKDQASG